MPGETPGRIFWITEKRLPELIGEGHRTLEDLVLEDERGLCIARFHLKRIRDRASEVPLNGQKVPLVGAMPYGVLLSRGQRLKCNASLQKTTR